MTVLSYSLEIKEATHRSGDVIDLVHIEGAFTISEHVKGLAKLDRQ